MKWEGQNIENNKNVRRRATKFDTNKETVKFA